MASPVCLITAGSAGLGAATARLFATAGYRVAINYHSNSDRAQNIVHELQQISTLTTKKDSNFKAIKADMSKKDEVSKLVAEAVSSMGRLDVVYSNHGWTELRGFTDLDANVVEEDWDRCFNMNVKSHLWLMHAAKPHLDETEGAFITTASLAGVRASGSSLVCTSTPNHLPDTIFDILTLLIGIFCDKSSSDSPCQRTGIDRSAKNPGQFCCSRATRYRMGLEVPKGQD